MRSLRLETVLLFSCFTGLLCGCGWAPNPRLSAALEQNRQLSERTQAQLAEIENLKTHSRQVEDQLIQAEDELAFLDEQYGIDRRKLANLRSERSRLRGSILDLGKQGASLGNRLQMESLAQRIPQLVYDPQTGIGKLNTDLLFDSGEDSLKPGARKLLRDLAVEMKQPENRLFKIMVVGHTDEERIAGRDIRNRYPSNWHLSAARSLAVVDLLREEGVEGDQLGTAAFSKYQPIARSDSPADRQQNRRVEIFIISPDVPVVGMAETLTNLY